MHKYSLHERSLEEVITESLKILKDGGTVAYPTESFYALGVSVYDESALKRLYELKKRMLEKALPLIVGNREVLKSIVKSVPLQAEELMKKFWPGPLTIIFDVQDSFRGLLTSSKDKVAIRIPGKSFALDLAKAADFPITATSANPSGKRPAQSAEEVMDYFGENINLLIDGNKTRGGRPSTIIDVTVSPAKIVREGSISSEQLR